MSEYEREDGTRDEVMSTWLRKNKMEERQIGRASEQEEEAGDRRGLTKINELS